MSVHSASKPLPVTPGTSMHESSDTTAEIVAAPLAVIGAGSWGTALAVLLAQQGHEVRLWGRDGDAICEMARARKNQRYLPDVELPQTLMPTADLHAAISDAREVLVTVPLTAGEATLVLIYARNQEGK